MNEAAQEVRRKLDYIEGRLPPPISRTSIMRGDMAEVQMVAEAVGKTVDALKEVIAQLKELADAVAGSSPV